MFLFLFLFSPPPLYRLRWTLNMRCKKKKKRYKQTINLFDLKKIERNRFNIKKKRKLMRLWIPSFLFFFILFILHLCFFTTVQSLKFLSRFEAFRHFDQFVWFKPKLPVIVDAWRSAQFFFFFWIIVLTFFYIFFQNLWFIVILILFWKFHVYMILLRVRCFLAKWYDFC